MVGVSELIYLIQTKHHDLRLPSYCDIVLNAITDTKLTHDLILVVSTV